ncbi:hypothetical protein KSP40_PGU014835 [Platanthera guangdongensis]|uniref:Uncharacterized protein n=1 Tax=Platanthera guangdongensis TaxID=2320717 RepID=A0ABR2MUK7_9ASPA
MCLIWKPRYPIHSLTLEFVYKTQAMGIEEGVPLSPPQSRNLALFACIPVSRRSLLFDSVVRDYCVPIREFSHSSLCCRRTEAVYFNRSEALRQSKSSSLGSDHGLAPCREESLLFLFPSD